MKDITELPYEYSHGKNGPIFFSFFFCYNDNKSFDEILYKNVEKYRGPYIASV